MLLKKQVVSRRSVGARIPEVAGRKHKAERCSESWVHRGGCIEQLVDKFINFAVRPFDFGHCILFEKSMCPKTAIFLDN
jgi:hypothetical protein